MKKWKGLQPPTQGAAPRSPTGRKDGLASPIGRRSRAASPVGGFKIGRKSRSRKVAEIFG